jgi:hypothetical protein
VSSFIGDSILLAGLRSQKKLAEKTEEELKIEEREIIRIEKKMASMENDLREIKELIQKKNGRKSA